MLIAPTLLLVLGIAMTFPRSSKSLASFRASNFYIKYRGTFALSSVLLVIMSIILVTVFPPKRKQSLLISEIPSQETSLSTLKTFWSKEQGLDESEVSDLGVYTDCAPDVGAQMGSMFIAPILVLIVIIIYMAMCKRT